MNSATQRRAHRAEMEEHWRGIGRLPSPQGAAQAGDAPAAAGGGEGGLGTQGRDTAQSEGDAR